MRGIRYFLKKMLATWLSLPAGFFCYFSGLHVDLITRGMFETT